jgi:hypothetical protein
MIDRAGSIDPWVTCLDPAEWLARLHRLPALAVIFGGPIIGLLLALAQDETDPTDAVALAV